MLTIVELNSWLDFEEIIKKRLLFETENLTSGPFIYRGHPDANWRLETTLERLAGENLSVRNYYRIIETIQPKIETFTNQKWDLPSYEEFYNTFKRPSGINTPAYVYMTYLRHFGFPSPLLDWTYSPFIAAYFAFRDVSSRATSIAIYKFLATHDLLRMSVSEDDDDVQIFPIAKSPRNNKRHELQQGIYTVCLREANNEIYYVSHEASRMVKEDRDPYVTKYILPASERARALHSLHAYNINSYSLFGTEESLLESLFLNKYKWATLTKKIMGDQVGINDIW